jgi:HSF-type DNA-binding
MSNEMVHSLDTLKLSRKGGNFICCAVRSTVACTGSKQNKKRADAGQDPNCTILSRPFFAYQDYSTIPDSDPTIPLTSIGKVPNFPAKMHAILSRADLHDVVSWMPHGRAWRVHKPKDFESRVIPLYFEHVKYSSFIRQANGWGFHRITVDSLDRNGYYHPMFLRGLPHLCKNMKRPGIAKKQIMSPEYEPDLHEISKIFPVPDKVVDDSVLLSYTAQSVPISRIPILTMNSSAKIPGVAEFHSHPSFSFISLQNPDIVQSTQPLSCDNKSKNHNFKNCVSPRNELSISFHCYLANTHCCRRNIQKASINGPNY